MKLELLDKDCKTIMVLPKVSTVLFFEGGRMFVIFEDLSSRWFSKNEYSNFALTKE